MSAFYKEEELEVKQEKTYLIVYRNSTKVFRLALEKDEYDLLKILAKGLPVGEAMGELAKNDRSKRRRSSSQNPGMVWEMDT